MLWTKVTPTTLPPDGEAVMVTVVDTLRHKKYVSICSHMLNSFWDIFGGEIMDDSNINITHWAPMPAPAED